MTAGSRSILHGGYRLLLYLLLALGLASCCARLATLYVNNFPAPALASLQYLTGGRARADGLALGWRGQDPVLRLQSFQLDEPGSLQLHGLDLRVDLLRSLLKGRLVLRRVEIDRLAATLELRDGGFRLAASAEADEAGAFSGRLAELLLDLRLLELDELALEVRLGERTLLLESGAAQLLLASGAEYQQLELDLLLSAWLPGQAPGRRLPISAELEFGTHPASGFRLAGHVRLPETEVGDFLAAVSGRPITSARMAADLWLRADQGVSGALLDLALSEVRLKDDQTESVLASDLSGRLAAVSEPGRGWRFALRDFQATLFGTSLVLPEVLAAEVSRGGERGFITRLPQLSLSPPVVPAEAAELLPFLSALQPLAPTAELEDAWFAVLDGRPRLLAAFKKLSLAPHADSPGIKGLQGVASLAPDSGWVAVNSPAFELGFMSLFARPWLLDGGRGLVSYEWQDDALVILSELTELQKGPMQVRGRFLLHLPPERLRHGWTLQLGVTDAEVADKLAYVPKLIGEQAYAWVERALVGGRLNAAGLVFHGALSNRAPPGRKTYDLFFDTQEGVLAYHPDWPAVTQLNGIVSVNNQGVSATAVQGSIYESRVTADRVFVPFGPRGQVDRADIAGRVSGRAQDLLDFLRTTPLRETLRGATDTWLAEGEAEGSVELLIPLGGRAGGFCDCRAAFMLPGIYLDMRDRRLQFSSLRGRIGYDPHDGLYSDRLLAEVLGRPLAGRIRSIRDRRMLRIDLEGRAELGSLRDWLQQPILNLGEGELDFTGTLTLPTGDDGTPGLLQLASDLEGVTVHLPAPLGKAPEDRVPFSYFNSFDGAHQTVSFRYDRKSEGRLLLRDGGLQAGLVSLYRPLGREPSEAGLFIEGFVPNYDVAAWGDWMRETAPELLGDETASSEVSDLLRAVRLDAGLASLYGLSLPDLRLDMRRQEDAWLLEVDSPDVKGRILAPDAEELAWNFDLDYLRIGEAPPEDEERYALPSGTGTDPMAGVDPRRLMPMDVKVDEFNWQNEQLGAWSFTLAPDDEGALITDLAATVAGLRIVGPHKASEQEGAGARLRWHFDDSGHRSHFQGRLRSDDLAATLQAWGLSPSMESSDLVLDSRVNWSGSPAMLSLQELAGDVDIQLGRGRFLEADERTGTLKLLGILDFRSLARRLRLDFSDVTQGGFSFDEISGRVELEPGSLIISRPLEIEGPSSTVRLAGSVDLATLEVDSNMVLTLSVDRNLPWFAALASGSLVGLKVFLAQKLLLDRPIGLVTSARYRISGTLENPDIELAEMFSDRME